MTRHAVNAKRTTVPAMPAHIHPCGIGGGLGCWLWDGETTMGGFMDSHSKLHVHFAKNSMSFRLFTVNRRGNMRRRADLNCNGYGMLFRFTRHAHFGKNGTI
jgi:hypothetical protein